MVLDVVLGRPNASFEAVGDGVFSHDQVESVDAPVSVPV
jgi:hypothetical protein